MPSLDLDGSPHSPRASRQFVNETAQAWGLNGDQLDVARLLATELVTNAMLHGAPPIRIAAHRARAGACIEVSYGSPQRPAPRMFDTGAPTGHGMLLLERLARRWGVDSTDGGKTVWFEVNRSATSPTVAPSRTRDPVQT